MKHESVFKGQSTLFCIQRYPHLHGEVMCPLVVFSHFRKSYHQAFLNALGEVAEASIHTLRHELKN